MEILQKIFHEEATFHNHINIGEACSFLIISQHHFHSSRLLTINQLIYCHIEMFSTLSDTNLRMFVTVELHEKRYAAQIRDQWCNLRHNTNSASSISFYLFVCWRLLSVVDINQFYQMLSLQSVSELTFHHDLWILMDIYDACGAYQFASYFALECPMHNWPILFIIIIINTNFTWIICTRVWQLLMHANDFQRW